MNKLKKILLGTLSVLTLGLFVATGARVDAAKEYKVFSFGLNESGNSMVGNSGTSHTYTSTVGEVTQTLKCTNETGLSIAYSSSCLLISYPKNSTTNGLEFVITPVVNGNLKLQMNSRADNNTKEFIIDVLKGDEEIVTDREVYSSDLVDVSFDGLLAGFTYTIKVSFYAKSAASARISPTVTFTEAAEVIAVQQEAEVGDVTYLRFVFIISNDTTLATTDFANKLTLILDEGKTTQQTKTCSPKAYDKLTLGGETYTASVKGATYSFDNTINTNDIYVVYVVKFTTASYTGHNVKASLNVAGTEFKTSGYDFK